MRTNALRGWPPRTGRAPRFPGLRVPRAPDLRRDAGFTLIETVVALGIATVVFTALAYAATTAVSSTFAARMNQQAIDLATQTLETTRALGYASIGHDAADLAGDPAVTTVEGCGTDCYTTAVGTAEPLVVIPAAGIASHETTVTENGVPYSVSIYATWPAEEATDASYKRVTVVVAWSFKGQANERVMSSLVSDSNTGLPLPDYQLTPLGETTKTVNPGGDAAYGFTIVNQGAPEQFNITVDAGAWTLVYDNGDGVFDAGTDTTPLSDSTSDGIGDTGRMNPNEEKTFWVVRNNPSPTEDEGTTMYSVSASSVAQAGTVQSVIVTLVIVDGVITPSSTPSPTSTVSQTPTATPSPSVSQSITTCSDPSPASDPNDKQSYTVRAYTLHNTGATAWPELPLSGTDPVPGTAALSPMYMDLDPEAIPAGYSVPVYSSDLTPADTGGRILNPGGSFDIDDDAKLAEWRTTSTGLWYDNGFTLRLWVAEVPGETAAPVSLTAQVFSYDIRTGSSTPVEGAATTTVPTFTCAGWEGMSFSVALPSRLKLDRDEVIGVQVWNSGDTKVRIAYDHETLPASLTVVEK